MQENRGPSSEGDTAAPRFSRGKERRPTVNCIIRVLVVMVIAVLVVLAGMERLGLRPPTHTATATPTRTTTASPSAIPLPTDAGTQTPSATSTLLPTRTATATPAPPGAVVLVNPPSQSLNLNQTVSVSIQVDTVTNLFGVDLRLTFDAARLEAQDFDGNAGNGVQIAPGDFLNVSQGFVAQNLVDNTTGQVHYVFALMSPATAVSGSGTLAHITFRAKGPGNAPITLNSVTLSDGQARPIPATLMNGLITVLPGVGPTPTHTPVSLPGSITYVVQPGDTLLAIAWRFRVSPWALMALNNLASSILHIGQVLSIP